MTDKSLQHCPLCTSHCISDYVSIKERCYYRCDHCQFIFLAPAFYLSHEAENAHYDTHINDPADQGYRQFLSAIANPLLAVLKPRSSGLDFGCGPGPTLSVMLEEQGHKVALYDLYYANQPEVLAQSYDFITATEVVEHLKKPGVVLKKLWAMVKPDGWLGLMTSFHHSGIDFSSWHYPRDPTHIGFFCRDTFNWLGQQFGGEVVFQGSSVVLFHKTQ